jgi:hypothetical protein
MNSDRDWDDTLISITQWMAAIVVAFVLFVGLVLLVDWFFP